MEQPAPTPKNVEGNVAGKEGHSLRFKLGIYLLILNVPFGLCAVAFAGFMALRSEHKMLWGALGIAAYALSWVMLGMGVLLAGPTGVKYMKQLRDKWFNKGS